MLLYILTFHYSIIQKISETQQLINSITQKLNQAMNEVSNLVNQLFNATYVSSFSSLYIITMPYCYHSLSSPPLNHPSITLCHPCFIPSLSFHPTLFTSFFLTLDLISIHSPFSCYISYFPLAPVKPNSS
jgi:hypothetical protein